MSHRLRNSFGLFDAPLPLVTSAFLDWQAQILGGTEIRMKYHTVDGPLADLLSHLYPIDISPTRSLFVPCQNSWTALFENGMDGTDAGRMPVLAERLRRTTMRVVSLAQAKEDNPFPAMIWAVYAPGGDPRRSIYSMNDGGRWEFWSDGRPVRLRGVRMLRGKANP